MLLAIDIGNSAIKFGVFEGNDLTDKFSIPTSRDMTSANIADKIKDRFKLPVEAAIACSVVPEIEAALTEYLSASSGVVPRFVSSSDVLGLEISFDVSTTGTDRLVNSFAAAERYGAPCIVVSLGTATTIDVVNRKRQYLGGLIAPGINVGIQALAFAASKLPAVEIHKPETAIATTTETAIQSGVIYGQIAMVEGLLKRLISELGDEPKVVATGGFSGIIADEVTAIDVVDTELLLNGLRLIADRVF